MLLAQITDDYFFMVHSLQVNSLDLSIIKSENMKCSHRQSMTEPNN